jgi:tetratricopeptide (TPR) repeat protein
MSIEAILKEKLEKILFLEVNLQALKKVFDHEVSGEIYLPIEPSKIIDEVKGNKDLNKLNIGDFIEGMVYVMGCDPTFKFNENYEAILKSNLELSEKVIKKAIYNKTQQEKLLDAYIMLKGLTRVEKSEDVYSKLLLLSENLRNKNKSFIEEENNVIEEAKSIGLPLAYYYESNIYYENSEYEKASLSLNEYFSLGGELNDEVREYKNNLEYMMDYAKGKEMLYENPKEALGKLLMLLDETKENAVLYYHIAVGYRLINNYEKAIYYLNEALSIDKDFVDVVNELGLNYACLGDYTTGVQYFHKVFEASNAIEVCTNIIMCYINMKDTKNAKQYLEIAQGINSDDEVLKDIEAMMEKLK